MRGNSTHLHWLAVSYTVYHPARPRTYKGCSDFQCDAAETATVSPPSNRWYHWLHGTFHRIAVIASKTLGGGDLREGLCPPHAIRMFWHWYKQSHPTACQRPPLKHTDNLYTQTPRQCLFFTYHYIHNAIYDMLVLPYGSMSCPDGDDSAWSSALQRVIIGMS